MNGNKFTKVDRILKRWEFVKLADSGNRVYNRNFIAVYSNDYNQKRSRLGVTVTKKVGCAVTRNRLKRYIREFFRHNKDSIAERLDINIIAKKAVADLSHPDAILSLRDLFMKVAARIQ